MNPTHHRIAVNGITLALTAAGDGPLVILCHGWPELGLSWRHQVAALAASGFRVAAPDMRGFGGSSAPLPIEAYSILHLVGDMVGLVEALGAERAVIVGHDWGAPVAWHAALLRPDIFRAVVGMSVPHRPRGPQPPLTMLRAAGLERFYWCYFQEPGVAEAEFERDPAATLRRLLHSGSEGAFLVVPEGGGFLDNTTDPVALPAWSDAETFAEMSETYRRTGFRGGLNWYRNIDRNWELTAPWQGAKITQPALFIAGARDAVIAGPIGRRALAAMPEAVPGLRMTLMLEGAGHWIQQERAEAVNTTLIDFLRGLPG